MKKSNCLINLKDGCLIRKFHEKLAMYDYLIENASGENSKKYWIQEKDTYLKSLNQQTA